MGHRVVSLKATMIGLVTENEAIYIGYQARFITMEKNTQGADIMPPFHLHRGSINGSYKSLK